MKNWRILFKEYLSSHSSAPKKATSQNSRFLQACKDYNRGKITHQKLLDTTVLLGFNNVIDAFYVVNGGAVPVQFYMKDYQLRSKKTILNDDMFELREMPYAENFSIETESRWNLVEAAWELDVSLIC